MNTKHSRSKTCGLFPVATGNTILVPVDFSQPSRKALRCACTLAANQKATLMVLHVVEAFHADMYMDTFNLQRERRRKARDQLRAMVADVVDRTVRLYAKVREGNPVDVITRFARACSATLIVLSTHGRTGLSRVLIGSVAERVVRHAPCSVLVVRPTRK